MGTQRSNTNIDGALTTLLETNNLSKGVDQHGRRADPLWCYSGVIRSTATDVATGSETYLKQRGVKSF